MQLKPAWALLIAVGGGFVGYWVGASTRIGMKAPASGFSAGQPESTRPANSTAGGAPRVAEGATGGGHGVSPVAGLHANEGPGISRDPRLLPKNGAMLRHEALVNIWMNKGKGISALGLDPERRAKLLDLLVDQYSAEQDAFDILGKSGPVTDGTGSDILSSVHQTYEKDVFDFLGQSDYDKLQSVSREANGEASVKIFLGTEMDVANASLTPDQLSAMIAIEGDRGGDEQAAGDSARLAKAAQVLTEQQLAIYRDYLKDRAASVGPR